MMALDSRRAENDPARQLEDVSEVSCPPSKTVDWLVGVLKRKRPEAIPECRVRR